MTTGQFTRNIHMVPEMNLGEMTELYDKTQMRHYARGEPGREKTNHHDEIMERVLFFRE